MFWFTRKPSSGNHSQYLAKITLLVKSGYVQLVQDVVSVMAAYCDLWGVCTVHCVRVYCIQYTVTCVILAKYWLWLPDHGFLVNRNMLEQFYLF